MKNPIKSAPTDTLKRLGHKYYNIEEPTLTEMSVFNIIIDELKVRLSKSQFEDWAVKA